MTRDGIERRVGRAQRKRVALGRDVEPIRAGRFLMRRIGAGGTGPVHLAHDSGPERDVAIVMLRDDVAGVNRLARHKYKRARADRFRLGLRTRSRPRAASSLAVRGLALRAFAGSLRQVPLRDQTRLEPPYFRGLTAREIGERLELPRGSIHRQLETSIERLRVQVERCLSGYDADSPSPSLEDFESESRSIRERLR